MRKRRKGTDTGTAKGKTILLLFVVIPLLGIALGYGISKILIIPYITRHQEEPQKDLTGLPLTDNAQGSKNTQTQKDAPLQDKPPDNNSAADTVQNSFIVEGFRVYRIQVGAFSKEENALKLSMELNSKGLAAAMDTDGMVKVYTHCFFTKDEAETALVVVKADYKDAHISIGDYPSVNVGFPDSGSKEAALVGAQLKECRDMLIAIAAADKAGNNIEGIIKEQKKRIEQLEMQISQVEWPPGLERIRQHVIGLYAAMIGSYSEYSQDTYMPGQASIELINCYIELLKRLSPAS